MKVLPEERSGKDDQVPLCDEAELLHCALLDKEQLRAYLRRQIARMSGVMLLRL